MRILNRALPAAVIFATGLGAGIYLQHRWPLGRMAWGSGHSSMPVARTVRDLAQIPPERRLVLVVVGQSNAADYGAVRAASGARVYVFAGGQLFAATDPLPGGDGEGGSVWSRLGARLIMTGKFDAAVLAVAAQGSTCVVDRAPGGSLHARLDGTLRQLAAAGLPADFILWQQGETEAGQPALSGQDYSAALHEVQAACHTIFPKSVFLTAEATRGAGSATNAQIRLAQSDAAAVPGGAAGPDLDQLGGEYRSDGLHFNERGLSAAADLWFEVLRVLLARRTNAAAPHGNS